MPAGSSWEPEQWEMLYPSAFAHVDGEVYQDLGVEMASPPVPVPQAPKQSAPALSLPPPLRSPGSTKMGCNHHLALLCFADNLFSDAHKIFSV